ncbi:MAG: efflux RND transporter permease subunit, partial [Pseudomonadota bacterium]|nr:efflux RND transporter permease subunit [Pseudomonadota bacterium]
EVRVSLPGADPEEVEHVLLTPLEATLGAISGVKHSYGTALPGAARVLIEFEVGEDEKEALVSVTERLRRFELPAGSGEARIQAVDVDDVPVFTLALVSAELDDFELRRVAERVLERLRGVPGVSLGTIVGGRPREIRLETTPERLQAFGLSLDRLAAAVHAANVASPLAKRVYASENRSVRMEERLQGAEQVAAIPLLAQQGQVLRVQDVADVADGPHPDPTHYTRFGFGPADPRYAPWEGRELGVVTIAVAKREGINAVDLTARLRERVAAMSQGFLPPAVMAVVTRDDGMKADRTVTRLVEHLGIAVVAVSLILLIFLGPRAALVVACAIPLVFAIVMGTDLLAGPTLNRITLYALLLALGMLVDDAIVVIENTHRRFHDLPRNASAAAKADAAVAATHEIGNPTTLATFTIVLVFLSLTLVTGMLGDYFYPVTFNVPVAMIASLLVAYAVTPWMARHWLPAGVPHSNSGEWMQRAYRALITPLLRSRWLRRGFYLLVLLLLLASFLQPAWQFIRPGGVAGAVSFGGVPLAFLPKDDKNSFLVHIHLPETTPLEVTDRAAREVEALLREHPHVLNFTTHVGIPAVIDFNGMLKGSSGNIGPQYAEIRVNLVDKFERGATSIDLVLDLRPAIEAIAARYPKGVLQLVEDPPGPPVRATVLAELYGPELGELDRLAHRVSSEFRLTHDIAEVWASVPFDVPEYRFQVHREKAALAGVDPMQVRTALKRLLAGETLTLAYPPGERAPVPVRLHIPREHRIDPDTLSRAFVENAEGTRIPLSELVKVVEAVAHTPINHKNGERVQYVGGELAASAPVYAVIDLDRRLDGLELAPELGPQGALTTANLGFQPVRTDPLQGYQVLWEGELRLTLDAFRDMGLALGLALVAIFLLLVGYYQSFRLPMLALVSVPLGFIGVFPGHWLLDTTFSAASMVGVIALAGVVVRNALLIIDFARDYQHQGYPPEEAVREAGATRLRPIFLTTVTIALGTGLMIPDPVFGGLAIALIFGALSSAVLTLLMVPLLYRRLLADDQGPPQ